LEALEKMIVQAAKEQLPTATKARIQLQMHPNAASMDLLRLVHTPQYLQNLESTPWGNGEPLPLQLPSGDSDTFISRAGLQAAYLAAGAVCEAVDYVMQGRVNNAFCCVRPPGHHAGRRGPALGAESNGFCILNNVACGCAHARVLYPTVKKIVVVDFDVHHGNGTEEILSGDSETMFLSLQRHGGNFFPCLSGSTCDDGNVCNVGLPEGYDSDAFRRAMRASILPKIYSFEPDLIMVSAGFDGHCADPIGGAKLTEDDVGWATAKIMEAAKVHCNGRVVSVLEGGYNAKNAETGLAACIAAHVKVLCGLDQGKTVNEEEEDAGESALGMMMGMDEEEEEPEVKVAGPKGDELERTGSGMLSGTGLSTGLSLMVGGLQEGDMPGTPSSQPGIMSPIKGGTPKPSPVKTVPLNFDDASAEGSDKAPEGSDKAPEGSDKAPEGSVEAPEGSDQAPEGSDQDKVDVLVGQTGDENSAMDVVMDESGIDDSSGPEAADASPDPAPLI